VDVVVALLAVSVDESKGCVRTGDPDPPPTRVHSMSKLSEVDVRNFSSACLLTVLVYRTDGQLYRYQKRCVSNLAFQVRCEVSTSNLCVLERNLIYYQV
jgi:hypothetical protein